LASVSVLNAPFNFNTEALKAVRPVLVRIAPLSMEDTSLAETPTAPMEMEAAIAENRINFIVRAIFQMMLLMRVD
jgi:hypothetical protein